METSTVSCPRAGFRVDFSNCALTSGLGVAEVDRVPSTPIIKTLSEQ